MPNRRLIEQRLSHLLAPADRRAAGAGVAVLFCELDGFKAINDEHGQAGDNLLRRVAERLKVAARAGDIIGRLGGDELVVLVLTAPDDDVPTVTSHVAERICRSLTDPFAGPGGAPMKVSVSIGIAVAEEGVSAAEMLSRADAAMYLAKRAGKDGFVFFRPASS